MSADIDALFNEDDNGALSVPLPDVETVNEIAAIEADMNNGISDSVEETKPQTGTPGAKVKCEICGKSATIKRDGFIGAHGKCEPRPQRGNRLETLPERRSPIKSRTRDFAVGIISWGVEEAAAAAMARPFGANPDDVPSELPDADVMIGAPLDLLWPEIPKAAQSFIDKLADNADVIECGIAWIEWGRTIGRWAKEQRILTQQLQEANRGTSGTQGTATGTLLPFVPAEER